MDYLRELHQQYHHMDDEVHMNVERPLLDAIKSRGSAENRTWRQLFERIILGLFLGIVGLFFLDPLRAFHNLVIAILDSPENIEGVLLLAMMYMRVMRMYDLIDSV
ncbi:hypothetical protein OCU04_011910 [Sclerotinia nivalis]|uniref:Uncharacterized protein n=1 Tax=Sclerotinia nivalis TaxID=352851 RepID=A0A9X0A9V7_9HELO|nr:hypothetical protein OCU04_011910 [Sclerotinia nivalis]